MIQQSFQFFKDSSDRFDNDIIETIGLIIEPCGGRSDRTRMREVHNDSKYRKLFSEDAQLSEGFLTIVARQP